ncbi:hypothetical protein MANES_06G160866v8 [Manihot esculenta]|uniref:Uncharacterized protein n=1 Tax=Manihot esculenta TaxID=3983 RepID=A0ACB7HQA7_MANES|nr:hypothetical protein MANES_06G160866v8 [Manihot esculenta]
MASSVPRVQSYTETKVRHFRRPNLPSAAESPLSSQNSTFRGKVRRPIHASKGRFDGRSYFWWPNLSSSQKGRTQLLMHSSLPNLPNTPKQAPNFTNTCITHNHAQRSLTT